MRTACVFAFFLACASWDVAAYVSDADAASSCHEAIPLEDTASLLQVKAQTAAIEQASLQGGTNLRDTPISAESPHMTGVCPEDMDMLFGEDCPERPKEITTTPAPFCVDGKTASGKDCGGKIKIKTMTTGVTRPCETASGDACEGEFQKKIREVYQDKGGKWVMIRREQSQDGGKTWSPLPMSLAELSTFTLNDEEANALIPADSCCVPKKSCEFSAWEDWTDCSKSCTRSRSRKVLSTPAGVDGKKCGCTEETGVCGDCQGPTEKPLSIVHVCAHVKDVSNHERKIAGAKVTTGDKEAKTDANGEFCFDLPEGTVKLTAEAKGYVTEIVERKVVDGVEEIDDIEMSGPLEEDQWRIVMKWHKKPKDLDSWTYYGKGSKEDQEQFNNVGAVGRWNAEKCDRYCKDKTTSGCAMSWIWKKNAQKSMQSMKCSTSGVTAFMDQDNKDIKTNPYAETTTLSGVDGAKCGDDCNIHFCVYQYSPRPQDISPTPTSFPIQAPNEIRESGATVEVYNGVGGKSHKVDTFEISKNHGIVKDLDDMPANTGASLYAAGVSQWFVFSIDAKTKAVTQCKDLNSECAKTPCGAYHSR